MVLRFYRSPVLRVVFGLGGLIAGLLLLLGDETKWRGATSFRYVSSVGGLFGHPHPEVLRGFGAVFIVYGCMLLANVRRDIAYIVGMILFAYFGIGLILTLHLSDSAPKNIVAVAAVVDLIITHWTCVRLAQAERRGLIPPDRTS